MVRLFAGTTALGAIAVFAMWPALRHGLGRDMAELTTILPTIADHGERVKLAQTVVARHPADYLLPLWVGQHELGRQDPASAKPTRADEAREAARRALPWINRGMYLAPHYSGGHRLAGRALMKLGAYQQGLSEYRFACESAPVYAPDIVNEVWSLTRSAKAVATVGGAANLPIRLVAARLLIQKQAPQAALDLLLPCLTQDTGNCVGSNHTVVSSTDATVLEDVVSAYWLMKKYDQLLVHTKALRLASPGREAGYRMGAMALVNMGKRDEAIELLDLGVGSATYLDGILHYKASLLLGQGEYGAVRGVAQLLLARAGDGPAAGRAAWLLGQVYRREGRNALALREMGRARDFDPQNLGYRLGIATVRESIGDYSGAGAELVRAKAELGTNPTIEKALARNQKASDEKAAAARWDDLDP